MSSLPWPVTRARRPDVGWAGLAAVPLENEHVRLAPAAPEDRAALLAIALDPQIWRYFVSLVETEADFDAFFDAALASQQAGTRIAYTITDKRDGQVAGSMSFFNLAESDSRIEIGWSWLGSHAWGRGVNRWAKYLMLEHAFEVLKAERVEFKTDELNTQARHALRNIGASEEGTLRSFNPMPGGRRRNAVFYSVLRPEWPQVRELLAAGTTTAGVRAGA